MSVHKEILEWSLDRKNWQRDALRRLVLNGELSTDDISDLTKICKSEHGLADQQNVDPLAESHIPDTESGLGQVTLSSIFHHRGVNALAEDQTLKFSPSLTVVYGDNAAGKTGYIRILKSACRARGTEDILGNVISGTAPKKPAVAIRYTVVPEKIEQVWTGEGEDESISRVSVFDTQCAAVYLTEKTDVAFRPFGLDLFDKLVQACKTVRSQLKNEQRVLNSGVVPIPEASEGTAVSKLLIGLSSLTKPETVKALAHLLPDEEERFALLEKSLLDLQANDPEKLAQQLTLRAGRFRTLARHLKEVEAVLSDDSVSVTFEARKEEHRKAQEAQRLRTATFPEDLIKGTGGDRWSTLWESARQFSEDLAYTDQSFPVVENDSRCVLCQQDLDNVAKNRLKRFEAFVATTTECELRQARDEAARLHKCIADQKTTNEITEETIKEIRIEHESLADELSAAINMSENRRKAVIKALLSAQEPPYSFPASVSVWEKVDALAKQLEERAKTLLLSSNDERKISMTAEVNEYRDRKLLAKHEQQVLIEIERKKQVAAYELCLNDTKTQAITQKSTIVTKSAVSKKLKTSFQDELCRLAFKHVEVELKEIGGEQGVLYHKLILTRAPGVELPKIVSEGEQRCLSIAAFFAELSTADDLSGIVFDDPVSSLDYKWREGVACRLVQEAKKRQVIVFTHDIVFLLLIKQFSKDLGVEQVDQHIRQLYNGAGVCEEELPWIAMPVKKKIGFLKKEMQAAEKLHRDGNLSGYEKEASYIYGLLRETWERSLEEVLLGGVVERFRPSIQTQQVIKIADITVDECKILDAAMSKCSKWLPGHDLAPGARADVPEPDVLKEDINALENWVTEIRKRRN